MGVLKKEINENNDRFNVEFFERELKSIEGISLFKIDDSFITIELTDGRSSKSVVDELFERFNIIAADASMKFSDSGKQYLDVSIIGCVEANQLIDAFKEIFEQKARIIGQKLKIDDTRDFFEHRTEKKLPHRYNYVSYQDTTPELALERDKYEKMKISPYLNVKPESNIIDIGCGVARWGDFFASFLISGKYVGIDYSYNILEIAKNQYKNDDRYIFAQESFQNIKNVIYSKEYPCSYDIVLINGILMYINDEDVLSCLNSINDIINNDGIIYIKESIGINDRFTLNHIFSKELKSDYSAIYRSVIQYKKIFDDVFSKKDYFVVSEGDLWEGTLANRKETSSYYWIIKKRR